MDYKTMVVCIIALVLIIGGPVSCSINKQNVMGEAVKNGADPTTMKCAMDASDSLVCVIKAAQRESQDITIPHRVIVD